MNKYMKYGCSVVASSFLLFGCHANSENNETTTSSDDSNSVEVTHTSYTVLAGYNLVNHEYSNGDLAGIWDEDEAVYIALNDLADGHVLTISEAGTYVLSGDLNGQIIVDANNEDKVQLVLNDATIASVDGPAIYVKQADKVFITLAEGTENTVTDSAEYKVDGDENNPNAVIFSQDDLTINGSGALIVNGNYNHGVVSKDDLVVTGGVINVNAVNNGLRGKDSVAIYDGEINITSGGDGIKSTNDSDSDKGWVSIDGGTIDIETELGDGIQAETILQVTGGTINIETAGGSENATVKSEDSFGPGQNPFSSGQSSEDEEESDSTKGLKAGGALYVVGGQIEVDTVDDSLHSDGNIYISDGDLTLASGDDGVHANLILQIDGGEILITTSYEGLEGDEIYINDGEIRLMASDDGLNASGTTSYLEINGGLLVVDASGDGIDSNGDILMTGGTVLVSGPTSNNDSALDHDGEAMITGGIFVAVGSSGMIEPFEDSSTQASLVYGYTSTQLAGTLVTIVDENGETIVSFAPAKDYQSVNVSAPVLEEGSTYSIYTGGTVVDLDEDGLSFGAYSAGTLVSDVTLSSTVTTSGSIQTMGGGPGGNMGGNQDGGPGGPGGRR